MCRMAQQPPVRWRRRSTPCRGKVPLADTKILSDSGRRDALAINLHADGLPTKRWLPAHQCETKQCRLDSRSGIERSCSPRQTARPLRDRAPTPAPVEDRRLTYRPAERMKFQYCPMNSTIRKSAKTYPGSARIFPGEYWRAMDRDSAYPEAFVKALTQAGFLAALIPEKL